MFPTPVLDYTLPLSYTQTNYHFELTGWVVCLIRILEGHLDQARVLYADYQGSDWHIPLELSTKVGYWYPGTTWLISNTSTFLFPSSDDLQSSLKKKNHI